MARRRRSGLVQLDQPELGNGSDRPSATGLGPPGQPKATDQATKDWYKDTYLPRDFTDGWAPQGNPWECPVGAWACKGINYIHTRSGNKSGSANATFADTHAKGFRFGQFKVESFFPDLP